MARTQLTWETVEKYQRVSDKYNIYQHKNHLYYATEEGGIAPQIVIYDLPFEYFELLKQGKRSIGDIHFKLRHGVWPAPKEVQDAAEKRFIENAPAALIANPKARNYFTQEELENLIPLAEKIWIEDEGKLPDDYVSPLNKN